MPDIGNISCDIKISNPLQHSSVTLVFLSIGLKGMSQGGFSCLKKFKHKKHKIITPTIFVDGKWCACGLVVRCGRLWLLVMPFFSFPARNQEQRQLWIKAVNRQHWNPSKHTVICSSHFVGGKYSPTRLDPNYVPTIFPSPPEKAPMKEVVPVKSPKVKAHLHITKNLANEYSTNTLQIVDEEKFFTIEEKFFVEYTLAKNS